ncbi:MAG: hypothetical protein RLZZ584_4552 [Pseudomonadota bacterium]
MADPTPGTAASSPAPAPAPTHLLYLHGFRSSPLSFKAQRMARWVGEHNADRPAAEHLTWACPQLPASPREAVELIAQTVAGWPVARTLVFGSSLGGWYATVLAERLGPACRVVLVNPAVYPARDLARYIGELPQWHDPAQSIHFQASYIDELHALQPRAVSQPQRYCTIIARGDEVLDWREMSTRYAGTCMTLLAGGDHGLSDFEQHLPHIP